VGAKVSLPSIFRTGHPIVRDLTRRLIRDSTEDQEMSSFRVRHEYWLRHFFEALFKEAAKLAFLPQATTIQPSQSNLLAESDA
jgi:hypothetical protein